MYSMNLQTFSIDEKTRNKLLEYAGLLAAANARARLTGPSDPKIIYEELITDALYGFPFLDGFDSFVDVGTGGGLPGIVWGICKPEVRGVLLDSIRKKADIVNGIIKSLGCENIVAIARRSEDFAAENREIFGVATARALAPAPVLAEYLSPLVRVGGIIVAFKGDNVRDELTLPEESWAHLGMSPPKLHEYTLSGKIRYILTWKKESACPLRYPRKAGIAVKRAWHTL